MGAGVGGGGGGVGGSRSRRALATAKRQINGGLGLDTPSGVEHERSEFIKYLREPGSDAIEGFNAEQEQRPPSWA